MSWMRRGRQGPPHPLDPCTPPQGANKTEPGPQYIVDRLNEMLDRQKDTHEHQWIGAHNAGCWIQRYFDQFYDCESETACVSQFSIISEGFLDRDYFFYKPSLIIDG